MALTKYVALLRGINVGGRNIIPMQHLRDACEAGGLSEVRTYIQSGNVLFSSATPRDSLEAMLEELLERRFGTPIPVVARSHRQLRALVDKAPAGFGTQPDLYHSDALFLKSPLTSEQVLKVVKLREEVDEAWAGVGVVYFSRLSARRTQSRMSRLASTPEYRLMTIRSWATTMKILHLLDEAAK